MNKTSIIVGITVVTAITLIVWLYTSSIKIKQEFGEDSVVTSTEEKTERNIVETGEDKVFDKTSLKEYDGRKGNPLYVAVDGVVYDISDRKLLRGEFRRVLRPGRDSTRMIKRDPKLMDEIKNLPIVGTYNDEK